MNNAIANLFPGHVAIAISHTLVHSLWQGALLSAVTGLIMAGTRKSSSAMRYNLLVAAMALFAVVVAYTFIAEFNNGDANMPALADQIVVNSAPVQSITIKYLTPPGSSIIQTIGSYLNRYASVIVWIWLLMVCARCVQLATGLREVYRLRHKNTSSIGSYWEERVWQLGVQLGIKRLVGIAQSARAKTPMVTGHLKPLILIPIGMLTSLSTEQAEAVLLHELAHIRRSDYLVNLLQNIMEIIFFFNPAVLWLSALIKAERENCCDDIAVARSGKVVYLKALVACEEYNMPLRYAMALKTSNSGLKKRVARIIYNKSQTLNGGEKSLLAVCLIAVGIFAMAFADGGKTGKKAMAGQKDAAVQPMADSIPGASEDTVFAKQVADTTKKHTNAAARDTVPVLATNGQTTAEDKPESDSAWTQAYQNKHPGPYDAYLRDRSEKIAYELIKDNLVNDKTHFTYGLSKTELIIDGIKQPEELRLGIVDKYFKPGDDFNIGYTFKDPGSNDGQKNGTDIFQLNNSQNESARKDWLLQKMADNQHAVSDLGNKINLEANEANNPGTKIEKSLIADLKQDNVISNDAELSFTLNDKELIVNGVLQPSSLRDALKAKYLKGPKGYITFNKTYGHSNCDIHLW